MPPGKRRPGRPLKRFHKRGRQAQNDTLRIFDTSSSPTAESPQTAPIASPNDSEIIITPRRRAYLDMIYETHSVPPPVLNTSRSTKPLLLDSIKHLGPVWKDMGHVLTTKLPDWFDAQFNDYNPYRTITSVSVDKSWFGHPNDTPVDVRAQPFILFWNETSGLSLQGCEAAILQRRVVTRFEYKCRGACALASDTSDSATKSDQEDKGSNHLTQRKMRWKQCPGQVTLVLEAYADDLTRVTVWQSGTHEDANPTELLWSRRLRNLVSERLRLVGVKATMVMRELVNQYRTPLLTSRPTNAATDIGDNFPTFRRPTAKQIRQLLPAVVRRAHLDQDPFTAVTILKNRNPHKIYKGYGREGSVEFLES
ncbi:hypothetical protein JB92DRAFT_3113740 [Gautieria morchelliformis]|nr:hypothetical protein JB92DRAFT_3113740 [Gautieria morchelliformis]